MDRKTASHGRGWTGLIALAAVAGLAAGCSSANRTAARGWEFNGTEGKNQPASNTSADANPNTKAASGANTTGSNNTTAANATTGAGSGKTANPGTLASNTEANIASPYSQLAIVTTAFDGFGGNTGNSFDAPYASEVFSARSTMMFDGMEGLSQVTFAGEGAAFDPCLSRDGRFVVFSSTQHRPTADIYIKPVHGKALTQLTSDPAHDVMPALSPDGGRIAFVSNRTGNFNIYVMSASGGQAARLTSGSTTELAPSWSPDGTKIAFCRMGKVSGRWEMWVLSLTSPKTEEFIGYGVFPKWCPVAGTGENGSDKLLFQRSRERGDRAFSLWTVDYRPGDVSSPTEIASSTKAALINPAWSNDGQFIAYAAVPNPEQAFSNNNSRPAAADIWLTSATGSGSVNLTSGNFVNLSPTWGADNRLFFVSNRGGVENVWSIATGKAVAAVTGFKNTFPAPGNDNGHHGHSHGETAHVPTP